MDETRDFPVAPATPVLRAVTAFTLTLLIGVPLAFVIAARSATPEVLTVAIACFALSLALVVFLARFCVIRGYRVTAGHVIVRHLARDRAFDRRALTSAEVEPHATAGSYVMPNGGFFSFGGSPCRNRNLGWFEAYFTDRARCVVIRFDERILVLTPSDPEAFVAALRDRSRSGF